MRVGGHDRAIRRGKTLLAEPPADKFRDFELRWACGSRFTEALTDSRESLVDDAAQSVGRPLVAGQLLRRPALRGVLHQVGRRNHLRPHALHQLDGAGVNARHAGQTVARRIFHRHLRAAGHGVAQGGFQRGPAAVHHGVHAGVGKFARVDVVCKQAR